MSLAKQLTSAAPRLAAPPRMVEPASPDRGRWAAWAIAAAVGATIALGMIWRAAGGFLGTDLPPFILGWQPAVSPYALVAVLALGAGVWLAPALYSSRLDPIPFGAALTAIGAGLRLALNLSRVGPSDWYGVFVVHAGTGEGRHEYLPALPFVRGGEGGFLAHFDRIAPALPTHPSGHPPGLLVTLDALRIDTPQAMAALTIGVGVLAIPLLYLLVRNLLGEGKARIAGILLAFSPATLLYGATSADALYATLGVAAAAALTARERALRTVGALALAIASFFSFALLAVGAWAVVLTERRSGPRPALILAALCAAAVIGFYTLLHVTTGFDPISALRVMHDRYYAGIGGRRPYLFWLFGSPAAFLVALGVPIAWQACRSLGRGEASAVALAVVVAASSLLGYTKAETERIWLFMVPLACLAAAQSQSPGRLRLVLALLGLQGLAVEILFNTIW